MSDGWEDFGDDDFDYDAYYDAWLEGRYDEQAKQYAAERHIKALERRQKRAFVGFGDDPPTFGSVPYRPRFVRRESAKTRRSTLEGAGCVAAGVAGVGLSIAAAVRGSVQ